MTESEIIYELLQAIKFNRRPSIKDTDNKLIREANRKIAAYRLTENTQTYGGFFESIDTLTENGYAVINAGGFDEWIAEREKKVAEAHQAIIDSAKATVDSEKHAKQSKIAAWIASIVAILTLTYAVYQSTKTDKQSEDINVMRVELDTLKFQLKAQSQTQKPIRVDPQTQKMK